MIVKHLTSPDCCVVVMAADIGVCVCVCVFEMLPSKFVVGTNVSFKCFFSGLHPMTYSLRFWALIEPTLPSMVSVTHVQRGTFTESSPAAVSTL